jgi:hypothetical protein
MFLLTTAVVHLLVAPLPAAPARLEPKPNDPYFEKFEPVKAPHPTRLVLKKGDRLAICGDSITEQKMYSRAIETYLTICVPELEISVRQYGWGGETAGGFLNRMTNDCLRFQPTVATTCYGMNDHRYRPYEEAIGKTYREKSTAIVQTFKAHGVRVVQGSPGCVGPRPDWGQPGPNTKVEALNLSLCTLRNIGLEIARTERVGFADVFWPMFTAGFEGRQRYGTNYAIAGKDGVHPGWAGSFVMAYAFLKSFGLDGQIGTFTIDLKKGRAKASPGHEVVSAKDGAYEFCSHRYPFCATGEPDRDNSIRSAMTLVPFNRELNRLTLIAKHGAAQRYSVSWGAETRTYSAAQLAKGVGGGLRAQSVLGRVRESGPGRQGQTGIRDQTDQATVPQRRGQGKHGSSRSQDGGRAGPFGASDPGSVPAGDAYGADKGGVRDRRV